MVIKEGTAHIHTFIHTQIIQAKQDELMVIKEGTARSENPADNIEGAGLSALTTKSGCAVKAKALRPALAAGCMVNRWACFVCVYVCIYVFMDVL